MNLDDRTADLLGISAVIINDLKQRRQRDYDFDWDRVLQTNGDTGIKLQYTHCRLNSLIEKQGSLISSMSDADVLSYCSFPEVVKDHDANNLLQVINQFDGTMRATVSTLEACVLVNYLFVLCNSISKALKRVPVKSEPSDEVRKEKLLLFKKAQFKLRQGMEILGLQPLAKM